MHNFYQIPGGEDVVVRNEKRLLEEHGHTVFTYYRTNKELKEKGIWGKLCLPFTAVYSFRTVREVKKIIRENKIDIVHVHNTLTMVSPSVFYAAFRCHVPVVQTLHNFRMLCPAGSFFRDNVICEECVADGLRCAVRHKCYRGSTAQTVVSAMILKIHRMLGTYRRVNFICLTEFNRKKLLNALNAPSVPKRRWAVDADRVYIKPNFTFAEGLAPSSESGQEEYFLFAGRVEALKGIDIAIKAFEQLPEKKLYIAGTGPMMEEMQAYVKEHQLTNIRFLGYLQKEEMSERFYHARAVIMTSQCYEAFAMTIAAYVKEHQLTNIRFLGYLQKEEMSERFYHARAVIMTSQCYEAFAMTIAEAYSYGVPVIAGSVGNMDGMVKEGITGVKFEYNSAEELAEKVREFETLDVHKLKENARAFYQKRLRPEDNYKKLEEIYQDILRKHT